MSEYHFPLEGMYELTREQMFLFSEKIQKRKERDQKFQMNIHGVKYKTAGLDTDGAIPIETIIDSGKGVV